LEDALRSWFFSQNGGSDDRATEVAVNDKAFSTVSQVSRLTRSQRRRGIGVQQRSADLFERHSASKINQLTLWDLWDL
jgi:hypothetical protein